MRAICVDGTGVECGKFKTVNGGVVLTADEKRKAVIGFVPTANSSYILPDDVAAERTATADESEATAGRTRRPERRPRTRRVRRRSNRGDGVTPTTRRSDVVTHFGRSWTRPSPRSLPSVTGPPATGPSGTALLSDVPQVVVGRHLCALVLHLLNLADDFLHLFGTVL